MLPNSKNFCGGNFQDWLEVKLIDICNGKCSWCIEKDGYNPAYHAPWEEIAKKTIASGKTNIILLGGEPTLYRDLLPLVTYLFLHGRKVWITTNGSRLTPDFVKRNLRRIFGINISIHNFNLFKNKQITGCSLSEENLTTSIVEFKRYNISVRLNCNCINSHIDSIESICEYIEFAKSIGAHKIRFAELKQDDEGFVDLAKILNYKYGLNDNPFIEGCNSDTVINGMPVNFRQMCGLQTSRRVKIENPKQILKTVLYYDGKFYDGWQNTLTQEEPMQDKDLIRLLEEVAKGTKSVGEAALIIGRDSLDLKKELQREIRNFPTPNNTGCCY